MTLEVGNAWEEGEEVLFVYHVNPQFVNKTQVYMVIIDKSSSQIPTVTIRLVTQNMHLDAFLDA